MEVDVDEESLQRWKEVAVGARWAARVLSQTGDPTPTSNFAAIDKLCPNEKASVWCRGYLDASVEHMSFWADFVAPLRFHPEHRVVHQFRPVQSLARAAIESSAQALWLLLGDGPKECARRHLSLMRWDVEELRKSLPLTQKVQAKDVDAGLVAMVAAVFTEDEIRPPAGYLYLIRDVASRIGRDPDESERIWRAASGSAHGKRWPAIELQTHVRGEEYEPGQFRSIAVPDPDAITRVVDLADQMLAKAVTVFLQYSGADFNAAHKDAIRWLASISPLKEGVDAKDIAAFALDETGTP